MIRGFFLLILISSITILTEAAPDPLKNLAEVGVFKTTDPHGAEFFKEHLFIADGNLLLVYNTSDPERPRQVATFRGIDYPGKAYGLSISENQLYVAAGPGWIYVLNISNPEKPKKMYQITYFNFANDVAVSGKYMYVADANTGMLIFDLSDKRNPELIGTFYVLKSNISGFFQGWGGTSVAVSGNYAFLSGANKQGFYIVDVSDPAMPKEVYHSIGKEVYDIAISENDVYLARADGTSIFELLDVSNPYAPKTVGTFSIIGTADRSAIAIMDDYIYAASGDTWHIFRKPDTTPPQIIIEKPKQGEILTNQTITVSGTAYDKSGLLEVRVNGKFAGTEVWNQAANLVEGINNITITASDKNGNNLTKSIQVTYRPVTQVTVTPVTPPVNATTTTPGAGGVNILFPILIILICWFWLHKIKRL